MNDTQTALVQFDLDDTDANIAKIHRFLDAARRGGPTGSGGEKRARRLAGLIQQGIRECAGTDQDAVEGAALLLCYAATSGDGYCTAEKLLEPFNPKARS